MDTPNTEPKAPRSYLDHVVSVEGAGPVSTLDSLSKALKAGFLVLKVLMLVLAVVFLFSNIFWVPEGTVAVQCRFGRIVGRDNASVRPPGGPYLAFPYPMDRIVQIPTTIQKVALFRAFWSETDSFEPTVDDRAETEGLRPGVQGSLLTADKNIVQGTWVVHYKVDFDTGRPEDGIAVRHFATHVGSVNRAEEIIRRVAQAAIIRVVSKTEVADFVAGRIDTGEIKGLIEADLMQLETGLKVTSVSTSRYAAPKILVPDFQAVSQAESQKALEIEKASRHRISTLNELAGSGWQELLEAVDAYEEALRQADGAAEESAFEAAKRILVESGTGGRIQQLLDEARGEKTETVQRTRASVARFTELLPAYERNPAVLRSQLVQDAVEAVWSDVSVESLCVPRGQRLFLDLGRKTRVTE